MPSRFPKEAVLRDGRRVLIRPFTARDPHALFDFFHSLPTDVRRFAWANIDDPGLVESWGLQIDYAKRVQLRTKSESKLDLERQLRPTLIALGKRLTRSLATNKSALPGLDCKQLKPLMEWLKPDELPALCEALRQVRPASP